MKNNWKLSDFPFLNNKIRLVELRTETQTVIFYRARTMNTFNNISRSSHIRLNTALINLAIKRGETLPGASWLVNGHVIYWWGVYFPNEGI